MARDLLTPSGQGDDGRADESLTRALAANPVDPAVLTAALRQARVFVGVEARLTAADAVTGADKTSEMALTTLRTPSGATALPIFSSVSALTAWRSSARPVPVAAVDACTEAVRLGLGAVVIDVAGPRSASLDVGPGGPAPVPGGSGSDAPSGTLDTPRVTEAADLDKLRVTALRRPSDPDGPLSRRRVREALRTVTERVEVWPAELLLPGAGAPRPVLAVAVRQGGDADARSGELLARRLSRLLATDPAPAPAPAREQERASGPAVLLVSAREAEAVRRHLGRGLRPTRRWPVRFAR
ncbi:hypothetical protein ThrDRAFT_03414 [Frankia casuarinae]|uniref:SseB protein N-terminal domain-containing protein n=1 Tax=Frankia casuarinae (strain DSM 45818 / CECT 9043 / HFP020203 / CcI3) TaxID=106370 RepID=Q2J852_FRACC|nr:MULTISPECIES: SseB family protein [Frankia]ABD12540.1 hypothetical protein Francci3_3183 [Frankia casuarinae]ETA01077.1 hypothetical protein CcI6DRAFT_03517 [Frankia sp. CcI6]EYT90946.1 hypothetical protein ThrDRAFT_03414 [Frankia casuarinae]OFB42137.1 hypothetical protein Manayef4_15670 [Frankia sp. CgIM4]OHV52580.1 hypothetical protein CgIS1_16660 [Frankia sp. CgIS1]